MEQGFFLSMSSLSRRRDLFVSSNSALRLISTASFFFFSWYLIESLILPASDPFCCGAAAATEEKEDAVGSTFGLGSGSLLFFGRLTISFDLGSRRTIKLGFDSSFNVDEETTGAVLGIATGTGAAVFDGVTADIGFAAGTIGFVVVSSFGIFDAAATSGCLLDVVGAGEEDGFTGVTTTSFKVFGLTIFMALLGLGFDNTIGVTEVAEFVAEFGYLVGVDGGGLIFDKSYG